MLLLKDKLITVILAILTFGIVANSATAQVDNLLVIDHSQEISDRAAPAFADREDTIEDRIIFQKIIIDARRSNLKDISLGQIIQEVASKLLGAKYQAGLLDRFPDERLVISLQKFDCLLLVETVLAIAKNIALQDNNYDNFTHRVQQHRYNNGEINGYCSRLHYFSDWIRDNQVRGNVENITSQLGGISLRKKLNFMTSHRRRYPQLIKNEANYQCIAAMETSLEELDFNYIPTNKIRNVYSELQPGDIIGIATSIPGLDVTHTGLVYRHSNSNLGLIHASPAGKVVIAADLQSYVRKVNKAIGIVVVRSQLKY